MQKNLKVLVAIVFSVCFAFLLSSCKKQESSKKELRVFVWSDYLSDQVIQEFEKEHNVKVILDYFASNEEMLAKIQTGIASGSKGYDLIFPSDYMLYTMKKLKLLLPLDHSKLSFLPEMQAEFRKPVYDPELEFSIPYAWGTTGVVVNTKLLSGFDKNKILSWKDIFENPDYTQKISVKNDIREIVLIALLIHGKNWTNATEADIKTAFAYLSKIKKQIKIFTDDAKLVVENDECSICQMYSGDAMQSIQLKPELQYFIPQEGGGLWVDNLSIPKNAANPDLALAFINKVMSAKAAKVFIENLFFASANAKAKEMLSNELKNNAVLYPSQEVFQRLHYLTDRPELNILVDRLWTEFKAL